MNPQTHPANLHPDAHLSAAHGSSALRLGTHFVSASRKLLDYLNKYPIGCELFVRRMHDLPLTREGKK